jgi:hypothetical protein
MASFTEGLNVRKAEAAKAAQAEALQLQAFEQRRRMEASLAAEAERAYMGQGLAGSIPQARGTDQLTGSATRAPDTRETYELQQRLAAEDEAQGLAGRMSIQQQLDAGLISPQQVQEQQQFNTPYPGGTR